MTGNHQPANHQPAMIITDLHVDYDDGSPAYRGEPVLTGANLALAAGEILGLLGASGSGKSTLLRAIAGLQRPRSGRIELAGNITDDADHHTPPHLRDVTMVFQDAQLFPHRTVAGNVAYGLEAAKVPKTERTSRVTEALEMVAIPELANRAITELSGGQAQRVALARCLVIRPAIILFDEPLSALDRGLRQRLAVDIRTLLQRTGTSAVYVTHDPSEATTVADRIAVVEHGRITDLGPVATLEVSKLSDSVASLLGGLGEIAGTITATADDATTVELADRNVVLPGRQGTVGDTITLNISR